MLFFVFFYLRPLQSGVSRDEVLQDLQLMRFAPSSGILCKSPLYFFVLFYFAKRCNGNTDTHSHNLQLGICTAYWVIGNLEETVPLFLFHPPFLIPVAISAALPRLFVHYLCIIRPTIIPLCFFCVRGPNAYWK